MQRKTRRWLTPCGSTALSRMPRRCRPTAPSTKSSGGSWKNQEVPQEENLSQLLQIRRDKLMGERFTRFLKAVNAAGNGVEMNKFYLDQLSTHPDLTSPNVLDVLRELSEVATLAVVTNGFDRVQSRRVRESGILDFVEDVFVSEKMDSEKPNRKIFDAALRALGVENREHVLMVGDSLSSDVQGGVNAGLDTCWYNPNHAENPGKVVPTYEISSLEELYPLVMEPEELANVGLKNRRHQL